jgi:hypothetical protein
MLRPEGAEGRPYLTFASEQEYRDHVAQVVGIRIGREQRKLQDAQDTIAALEATVAELEDELAAFRRRSLGEGTPL